MTLQKADSLGSYEVRQDIDLDFAKANTFYATHRMHSFGAKFPPQLAHWAITRFTEKGETVLDPMVGSGTTLVEAIRLERNALGSDIDPLARLVAKVKSTPIDPLLLSACLAGFRIRADRAFSGLDKARSERNVAQFFEQQGAYIPDFPNRDYWFLPEVQEELALLVAIIGKEEPRDFVDFLYVVFSATIITKGKTSVANVMDLAHSRPHYRAPIERPDVLARFMSRLDRLADDLMAFSSRMLGKEVTSKIVGKDARHLPITSNSVELVFTSPPYVNAIDYPRVHKFSIFWLPQYLNTNSEGYTRLGTEYIGTERVPKAECLERVGTLFEIPIVDKIIQDLAEQDTKRAGVTHRYFDNINRVLAEICRVLVPERLAGIVVAPSNIKGIYVPTHQMIAEIGSKTMIVSGEKRYSFEVEDIYQRAIDDSKRQLPYIRGEFGPGMRDEFVIMLKKIEIG